MTTYVIGDVQGCYDPLQRLLDKIDFDEKRDNIWFTGDLVNRGPNSLGVLRFVYEHRNSMKTVLGNHDMTLLAVAEEAVVFDEEKHTFSDILKNDRRDEYLDWLKHCPLVHVDEEKNTLLVHAGLVPNWDLSLTQSLAKEVEECLQSSQSRELLRHLYGNTPNVWSPDLSGWPRFRLIVNVLTRIRFCTQEGVLDFLNKENQDSAPLHYFPWFTFSSLHKMGIKIIFGHWAALEGKTNIPQVIALDTGCVWGKKLTAYAVETGTRHCLNCPPR